MYLPYMVLLVFGLVCLDFFAFFCDGFGKLASLFGESLCLVVLRCLIVLNIGICFYSVCCVFAVSFHEPQNSNSATGDIKDMKAKIRVGFTSPACNIE